MPKNKIYINIILILILTFFAANLCYPGYFNRGADFLNAKFNLKMPHFWGKPFLLGLDLQGGAHLLYQADLSNVSAKDKATAMEGLRDIIERRVNLFGVSEPVVQVQGERLIVELAGVLDVSEAIKMIGQTPFLEFKEQKNNFAEIIANNKKVAESATGIMEDPFQSTSLTGKYLKRAEPVFDQTAYKSMVSLQFNDEGAKIFEELTTRNVGKILAIYIDGQLISAPTVQEAISGGKAQITGSFTVDEAKKLTMNLNAGALPVPITLISQQTVGPTLGRISLEQSLKAGLYGFLAVILFMIIFYRLPGIMASLALIIYIALVLALFKIIPVTLTLAGIAGFLLSIGMAVDANILIFARMKEELSQGKNLSLAIEEGFKRAWPSIRDSNFNTLIVSAILFGFTTSFIKGFALTLGLGVVISMFSAIMITRNFLRIFIETRFEKINWLWKESKKYSMKIDFLKHRKIYYIFSGILIIASLFCIFKFGLKPGIDFAGGSIMELDFKDTRPSNKDIETILNQFNLGEVIVQPTGDKGVIIRMKDINEETHQAILEKFPGVGEKSFQFIGPSVGRELRQTTAKALILALIAIAGYIAFAFRKISRSVVSWQYGIATLVALFHDVLIPLGVFAILGKFYNVEITIPLIAVLLTILGYSVHDTIVIFDRIRENLLKRESQSFEETVNFSLNQILGRSINTVLTVLFVVFAIFIFGGETLRYFSLALIIGIISGTYSSIFIASSLIVTWHKGRQKI